MRTFKHDGITWECPYWDLLPPLDEETFTALREDIRRIGIQYPVQVVDLGPKRYRVLDGYHRLRACVELAQEHGGTERKIPVQVVGPFAKSEYERAHAIDLNLKRRHLSREDRRALVVQLAQAGKSIRGIAADLGVPKSTVLEDLQRTGVRPRTPQPSPAGEHPAPRLSISTSTERHDAAQSMYDAAEQRRQEARSGVGTFLASPPGDTPQRAEDAPLADPLRAHQAPTKKSEPPLTPEEKASLAESVEVSMARSGPLDGRTLLPSPVSGPSAPGEAPSKTTGAPAIAPSGYDGWNTPPELLKVIARFAGTRGIALDPCSNGHSEVPASIRLGRYDCGLQADWYDAIREGGYWKGHQDTGIVYVNPPYDQATLAHTNQHAREQARTGLSIVTLVPAKVDQQWYQDAVSRDAAAVCFVRGRVGFWREGQPAQGSAFACLLLHYGAEAERFCEALAGVGVCLDLERARGYA